MALLDGKTALVTGVANRWSIATGIARALHTHGARLRFMYQGDRVRDEVEKLAAELGSARCYPCDVRSDTALAELAAAVRRDYGSLDVLVHSIAYTNKEDLQGKVYTTSRDGFALALDISSYSLIALSNALVNLFNDDASIIALTYRGSTSIVPNYNLAGIAKAALEAIVRYLAYYLGPRGIRVNAISAGPISTASSRQVRGYAIERLAALTGNVWIGGLAAVVFFTIGHVPRYGFSSGLVAVAIIATFLSLLYMWRRSLWAYIWMHWIIDGTPLLIFPLLVHPHG